MFPGIEIFGLDLYIVLILVGIIGALVAIGKINGLVSVAKLGFFNVSSAFVNLSQLKSTYALVGESGIAQGIKAMSRMNRVDKRVIEETGVRYNIGLGFTKRRIAPNSGKAATAVQRLRNAYNAFADKSMVLFKTSEAYIRKLTVLSAYYKGIEDGMSHKEAIEFAQRQNVMIDLIDVDELHQMIIESLKK